MNYKTDSYVTNYNYIILMLPANPSNVLDRITYKNTATFYHRAGPPWLDGGSAFA